MEQLRIYAFVFAPSLFLVKPPVGVEGFLAGVAAVGTLAEIVGAIGVAGGGGGALAVAGGGVAVAAGVAVGGAVIAAAAVVTLVAVMAKGAGGSDAQSSTPATTPYKRPSGATTPEQRASVQGKPCVDCGETAETQVADHKTPLVKEHYETGSIDTTRMRSVDAVQPQCPTCSARQGAEMSRYSREQRALLGK